MARKRESTAAVKAQLATDAPRRKPIPDDAWLSLGATPLNLAVSGRPDVGTAKGHYLYYVGSSSSGKTWFAMQLLAEACRNKHFADHELRYWNIERGVLMDVRRYFGKSLAARIEFPKCPQTVQELYYRLDDVADRPGIDVIDSMDGLTEEGDDEKFYDHKEAFDSGKEAKGSYGMGKAKVNSEHIKRVVTRLDDTGSILLIISQERDMVNNRMPFPMKTRAGGHALKFYAHVQLWTSIRADLKRSVLGKEREYGKLITVDVQKNRVSGWEGKVTVPFLRGFGVDEVGACVDYLTEEKHWAKSKKGSIAAPEFDFDGGREELIARVEGEGGEPELSALVGRVWADIDERTRVKRAARYE